MTIPRPVTPGRFMMVTRRCAQRQFLLRPDDETNNAFTYCLAEAAKRFGMEIVMPSAMSNHHHNVLFDRFGLLPQFTEHFHKMLAKCMNCLRGRWENFWSSEQVCNVELIDPSDVIDKVVYAATNPVKDGLVERVHHWPGVNGLSALLNDRPMTAKRPSHFFSEHGVMPETVSLVLVIPLELGEREHVLAEIRAKVAIVEATATEKRARSATRVIGRRAILRQTWWHSPTSREPRRNLRPTVAASSEWSRLEAIQRNAEFLCDYRDARAAWLLGGGAKFPPGTYWLRRFANVPIAASKTN
ncbi:MAG: hypothetical protein H0X17_00290 [Deltaproteobacteria bacterium]|nr:hypothetical protein [Deltaproteobacteria bacterium]